MLHQIEVLVVGDQLDDLPRMERRDVCLLFLQYVLEQVLLLLQKDQVSILGQIHGAVHQPFELLTHDPAFIEACNQLLGFSQLDPAPPFGNEARQASSESLPHLVVLFLFVGHGQL